MAARLSCVWTSCSLKQYGLFFFSSPFFFTGKLLRLTVCHLCFFFLLNSNKTVFQMFCESILQVFYETQTIRMGFNLPWITMTHLQQSQKKQRHWDSCNVRKNPGVLLYKWSSDHTEDSTMYTHEVRKSLYNPDREEIKKHGGKFLQRN